MPRMIPRRTVYYDDKYAGVKRRVHCLACLDRRWVLLAPEIGPVMDTKMPQPCRACGARRVPLDARQRTCTWCEPRRVAAAIAAGPKPEDVRENPPWTEGRMMERVPCARCMGFGMY